MIKVAIIEFINGKNNSLSALKRVLTYITNPAKTADHLKDGHNCNIQKALNDFSIIKNVFHQTEGRQYVHFVQSFAPFDKVTPELVKKIADELVQHPSFNGYQVAYAVHTDKDHLHTHFVINTVNIETGKKWRQSKEELQAFKDYSDEICNKHGLIITQGKLGSHVNRGEFRTKEKGDSWKYELFLTVKKLKWISRSKDEFISNMKALGYQVDWTEQRKYITFTNKYGKKCRNRKLYPPEHFTKEALIKAFELNAQKAHEKKEQDTIEMLLSTIKLLQMNDCSEQARKCPLTVLEGEALKDKIAELKKGKGFDWNKESDYEI